jgi:hypothetical protein
MDSHEELYNAFRQYFKYNQIWLTKGTKRAGMDTRFWLSEIRRICSQRRKEIQEWRHEKNEITQKRREAKNQKTT